MRYFAIASLVIVSSCGDRASPRENPLLPTNDIVAVARPGEVALTSQVDPPIGFLIRTASSNLDIRWPPCNAGVAVSMPNVLPSRGTIAVPASDIPGYVEGEGATIYYRVLRRDTRIQSIALYICIREGQLEVTLR